LPLALEVGVRLEVAVPRILPLALCVGLREVPELFLAVGFLPDPDERRDAGASSGNARSVRSTSPSSDTGRSGITRPSGTQLASSTPVS
jgi:hypothetical protein